MIELLAGNPLPGETRRALQACNDYLRMGPGRSLQKLRQLYVESTSQIPPSQQLRTLQEWSAKFSWVARSVIYDSEVERQKNEIVEARRREALETGLALDFERVLEIKDLYSRIKQDLDEKGLYYTDRKVSAKGDVVEVEVFNSALLSVLRGLLDDAAKEVGGRKQKLEHSGPDGGPIQFTEVIVELPDESMED